MKTYGVIMAGGSGARFWPLSTKNTPKQLINLTGDDALINQAIKRIKDVCDEVFVVTNNFLADNIKRATAHLINPKNVICEPEAKNTAPCIGLAAIKILKNFGDGILVITPSDAYIKDIKKYQKTLQTAIKTAKNSNCLVTVGVKPTCPSTGYGYIKFKDTIEQLKPVISFVEKPKKKVAEAYIKDGNYLWNSGIFICKASAILKLFELHAPQIYNYLTEIYNVINSQNENKVLVENYKKMPNISLDYAVLEKAKNIVVEIGDFGWSDVGSWDALSSVYKADKNNNVCVGAVVLHESSDNVIYSNEKLVAVLGVENLIIVNTKNAVLVCNKQRAQDIKSLVDELDKKGYDEFL